MNQHLWTLVIILGCYTQEAKGQLTIADIDYISITDEVNINHEDVKTLIFEIRFNDSITLWHTKEISRIEYDRKHFDKKIKSTDKNISNDSLSILLNLEWARLKNDYQHYIDTVQAVLIDTIEAILIEDLLHAIQDKGFDEKDFLQLIEIDNLNPQAEEQVLSELEELHNLTYFPLIGITIYLKSQEPIIFFCESQSKIAIPWVFMPGETKNYNPKINWAIDKILPSDRNLNRYRISSDLDNLRHRILEMSKNE